MSNVSDFWDVGPHDPLPVEQTWTKFVRSIGGTVIAERLPKSPNFSNADFLFPEAEVVAELKEIQTEFLSHESNFDKLSALLERLVKERPNWKPVLFGGGESYPAWFVQSYFRIARPPLSRILKKANAQIRDTKRHLEIKNSLGVVIIANDSFVSIGPDIVFAILCELLESSYSSIDCLVYLTLNSYVEISGSDEPKLLWMPAYSERAPDRLVEFVDSLGRQWFDFLEKEIGSFTSRIETQDFRAISGSNTMFSPKRDS